MNDQCLGIVSLTGLPFAPVNTSFCSGQLLSIATSSSLYSLLGTNFGGDGRTTFALPDLKGQVAIGDYRGGTTYGVKTYSLGEYVGSNVHTLTANQMPEHTHDTRFTPTGGASQGKANLYATTKDGNKSKPDDGYYLAATKDGFNDGDAIYFSETPEENDKVSLSGLDITFPSGGEGTVTILENGSGDSFGIMQPSSVINYLIVTNGYYPSRN